MLVGLLSTRKSCIILCMSVVCSAVLNFCDESFSHINCLGKRINVSLVFSVAKWLFTIVMLRCGWRKVICAAVDQYELQVF